jgi:hypothetical protein
LNVPANGLEGDGAPFEHATHGRRPIDLGAPENPIVTSIDLALNVKALGSVVLDRESERHA